MPTWIEIIIRTVASVVILFFLTKMLGKRQVSQLSMFEYITGITIGSLAAYVSLEMDSAWYLGVLSLVVWSSIALGIEFIQMKSKQFRDFVDGKPSVVIQKGKILEDELKKERVSTDELLEQLRNKNVFQVADVEFAVMEPSGDLSVLLTKENRPLTFQQLGVKIPDEAEVKTVIMDGETISEGLLASGFDRKWLNTELEKMGVSLEEVFLGQVNDQGELMLDLYDDQQDSPTSNDRETTYITLKKCEADLETFALATQDQRAKRMYGKCAQQIQQVIKQIHPMMK